MRRRALMMGEMEPMPGFTPLHYIQCDFGTNSNQNYAVIDTGLRIGSDYRVWWKGAVHNLRTGNSTSSVFPGRMRRIFGEFHRTDNPFPRISAFTEVTANTATYNYGVQVSQGSGNSCQFSNIKTVTTPNVVTEIELRDGEWFVDGVSAGVSTRSYTRAQAQNNIFLGASECFTNKWNSCFEGRHYGFKIWSPEGALIWDGRPARRNSDGVAGMYEMVGRTFHAPVDMTGWLSQCKTCVFTAGLPVE